MVIAKKRKGFEFYRILKTGFAVIPEDHHDFLDESGNFVIRSMPTTESSMFFDSLLATDPDDLRETDGKTPVINEIIESLSKSFNEAIDKTIFYRIIEIDGKLYLKLGPGEDHYVLCPLPEDVDLEGIARHLDSKREVTGEMLLECFKGVCARKILLNSPGWTSVRG